MNGAPSIAVHHPASTFVGLQIVAVVRVGERVVLELADGSQLQFRVVDGQIEAGWHRERQSH